MTRAAVDVVVPFVGSDAERDALLERLRRVRREPGDTLTVVDNRPIHCARAGPPEVLPAPEVQSSYYARNRGAARGSAPWIVFLDADVEVEPGLLEGYFATEPQPRTGILGGAVVPTLPPGGGLVARYGLARRHLSSEAVLTPGHEFVLTANLAVRREVFEALDGFADGVRSGGDADFSFRVRDAGWAREERPDARVSHPVRGSLKSMLRVFARYGSGTQWLRRRYPTFAPPPSPLRHALRVPMGGARALAGSLRGAREEGLMRGLDSLVGLAFELGRFLPNEHAPSRRQQLRAIGATLRDRGNA